ncbi:universal stress protein [Nitrococcus mobilis]|nr:universal stress protein [Nitrococcus mobilis]
MKMLVATDFSARSQCALRRAGWLARVQRAELTIVHVVDDDRPARLVELERREAQRYLVEQVDTLTELRELDYRTAVVTGDAFDGILRTAQSTAADLIVMGSHRRQLLRDVFIGTTIERVIRTGSRPVLMVNNAVERPYRRVLAAVNKTEPAVNAIRTGKALGLLDNARLSLVHGFQSLAKGSMSIAGIERERINEYLAEELLRVGMELQAYFKANAVDVDRPSLRIREGGAFEVIFRAVRDISPDLLIIGTQARTGLAKLLLGSVAETVLRSVETDILVVPFDR